MTTPPNPPQTYPLPPALQTHLAAPNRTPTIVLTVGMTGSGKSTLARALVAAYPSFTRLSIDGIVLARHGVYGVDFAASGYGVLQGEAEEELKGRLKQLLREGSSDIVIDNAFYDLETRDEYRSMIREYGGGKYALLLVVFRGSEEALWRRVQGRRAEHDVILRGGRDGEGKGGRNVEGMSVDRETLRGWIEEFEWPVKGGEEGEIVEVEVI